MFIIILILLTLINSSSVPENGWHPDQIKLARPIMHAINKERRSIELYEITYDFLFNSELLELYPIDWYSQKSNKSIIHPTLGNPNNTISINAFYLMENPVMKWWRRYGYHYIFHYSKKQSFKRLVAIGRNCYDPWDCSWTKFTNYISCINPIKKCARANLIYPFIYMKSFSRISCIESGDFIICFGRYIPQNDYNDAPYDDDY